MTLAKRLIVNKDADTQQEVESVLKNLKAARRGLVKASDNEEEPIQYNKLEKKIAIIEAENLVASDYTETSWAKLQAALAVAKSLVENKNATSDEHVATVLAELIRAREGLKKVGQNNPPIEDVDYTALEKEIGKIAGLNREDYTTDTWNNLMSVLRSAREALNSMVQSEVDVATEKLAIAINSLKQVEKRSNNSWIWIVIVCVAVVAIAGAVIYINIRRKKQLTDSTPLVDINGDEAKTSDDEPSDSESATEPESKETNESNEGKEGNEK